MSSRRRTTATKPWRSSEVRNPTSSSPTSRCRAEAASTSRQRSLDAGVGGYLLKDSPARELADAVRRVASGGRAIDPKLALDSWTERDPLTERERGVLRLSAEGLSAAAIGERLGLTDGTVRNYLSEAGSKLGAANRVEAARIARDKGWL
jgi:two-component system response regulator DesR